MNNYYFTFGTAHATKEGISMADYWVRVVSTDYDRARQVFVKEFTSVVMERPDRFAFQYSDDNFKPFYCRKGEYTVIYDKQPTANL